MRAPGVRRSPDGAGWVQGLKVAAVAVVADAVWRMARGLCTDTLRRGIALATAGFTIEATLERRGHARVGEPSQRAYVLARRGGGAA